MSLLGIFQMVSDNLTYVLVTCLFVALSFRYLAYRSGKRDYTYFKTFTRTVEKNLEGEEKREKIQDVDFWLTQLLYRVIGELPERSTRFNTFNKGEQDQSFRFQSKQSFKEFAEGKKGIVLTIKQQVDAFKSPHPPNFVELTNRVLREDKQWVKVLGIPTDTLSRMLDILPGLFIVGGIFGTFLGITSALPMIAQIDLGKLEQAGPIINGFVGYVAFAMHTSIVGILCSVVMQVLNAMFPTRSTRVDVQKDLARCFEFIWYRIHGDKTSQGEARMIELLGLIYRSLAGSTHSGNEAPEGQIPRKAS